MESEKMVVVDGIRYRPQDVPKAKAEEAKAEEAKAEEVETEEVETEEADKKQVQPRNKSRSTRNK